MASPHASKWPYSLCLHMEIFVVLCVFTSKHLANTSKTESVAIVEKEEKSDLSLWNYISEYTLTFEWLCGWTKGATGSVRHSDSPVQWKERCPGSISTGRVRWPLRGGSQWRPHTDGSGLCRTPQSLCLSTASQRSSSYCRIIQLKELCK